MTATLSIAPTTVLSGTGGTLAVTFGNDGGPLEVTVFAIDIDTQLIDPSTASVGQLPAGWSAGTPLPVGTQTRFTVTPTSGYVLLSGGGVTLTMPLSNDPATGNVDAIVVTSDGTQTPLGPVSVDVTTQVAFTSLQLDPVQVGPDRPTTLSWDTVGAAAVMLACQPPDVAHITCPGATRGPQAGSWIVPASGQASVSTPATTQLAVVAQAADQTERQEFLTLWIPQLTLDVEVPSTVVDPGATLPVSYSVVDDPAVPTTLTLGWVPSSASVRQAGAPVGNGATLAAGSGSLDIGISATTGLLFVATRSDGVNTAYATSLTLGPVAPVTVDHAGAYVATVTVEVTAEGQHFTYSTGHITAPSTHTLNVPLDATSIEVKIRAEKFIADWKTILDATFDSIGTGGLSFKTSGAAWDPTAKQE